MKKMTCCCVTTFVLILVVASFSFCEEIISYRGKGKIDQSVEFKRTHKDVISRTSHSSLNGWLKKPEGNGPFPAVVMLIDKELRSPGDREWEEKLVGWGYVVLHVDSMGSRGIALYDYGPEHHFNLYWQQYTSRANDALDGKKYLAGLSFVNPGKIAVLGWGYGATALFNGVLDGEEAFQAAVAFYPAGHDKYGFYMPGAIPFNLTGFNAPLLLMAMDGPSKFYGNYCRSRGSSSPENSYEVLVNVYPVSDPGFDFSGERSLKVFYNIASCFFYHVELKYQEEAAMDSNMKVKNFLAKYLQNIH